MNISEALKLWFEFLHEVSKYEVWIFLFPKNAGRDSYIVAIVEMEWEIIQSNSGPCSLFIKLLIILILIQLVIQKLNLGLRENTFMSIENQNDSRKLSNSFLGLQVICNECIAICFCLYMNTWCVWVCTH